MATALPQSFIDGNCERELLGTCLSSPELAPLAAEKVASTCFGITLYAKIFRAIDEVLAQGNIPDEFTVEKKLADDAEFKAAGGPRFLVEITSYAVPHAKASAIDSLCESIRSAHLRRRFRQAAIVAQERSEDPLRPVTDLISDLRDDVTHLEDESAVGQRGMMPISDVTQELMPTLEKLRSHRGEMLGFSSGYRSLDEKTSGLQPGNLIILGARPSMGKTAFAVNIALRVALAGSPVAIFSLETPREIMLLRLLCLHGRINMESLTSGKATDEAWRRVLPALAEVVQLPIFIDDRPRVNASDLRSRIRAAARRFNVKLAIMDYLQLATARGDTRNDEVALVSGELQGAARELGKLTRGALIVLSQLNRVADGERPRLSHLRDSGAIEQDADAVWFICEPGNIRPGQVEPSVKELDIAKSRNGSTGTVRFTFIGQCMAFEENS